MIFKRFQHMKWSQTEENKSKINITFNIPVVCSLAWVHFNSSTVHLHLISKCFFWSLDSSWIALNHIHQQPPPHRACLSVLWKRFGRGVCTLSSMIFFFVCVNRHLQCNALKHHSIEIWYFTKHFLTPDWKEASVLHCPNKMIKKNTTLTLSGLP